MISKKKIITILMFLGIILGYYALTYLLGARTLCFFKNTFGLPCPGCGMTRSTLAFLSGDIAASLYYHPLLLMVALCFSVFLFRNTGPFNALYKSNKFWIFCLVLFVGYYAYRMSYMFPHTKPMDFYKDGLLPRLFS